MSRSMRQFPALAASSFNRCIYEVVCEKRRRAHGGHCYNKDSNTGGDKMIGLAETSGGAKSATVVITAGVTRKAGGGEIVGGLELME